MTNFTILLTTIIIACLLEILFIYLAIKRTYIKYYEILIHAFLLSYIKCAVISLNIIP